MRVDGAGDAAAIGRRIGRRWGGDAAAINGDRAAIEQGQTARMAR
jgi:hypothetical protein